MNNVRTQLIKARGERKQLDVANSVGISQKHLSKLELGKGDPSLKLAVKIAAYYQSSIENLFPDVFEESRK